MPRGCAPHPWREGKGACGRLGGAVPAWQREIAAHACGPRRRCATGQVGVVGHGGGEDGSRSSAGGRLAASSFRSASRFLRHPSPATRHPAASEVLDTTSSPVRRGAAPVPSLRDALLRARDSRHPTIQCRSPASRFSLIPWSCSCRRQSVTPATLPATRDGWPQRHAHAKRSRARPTAGRECEPVNLRCSE